MFIVPGLVGVILTMRMMLMTALAVVRERERGTFEFLIATPVRRLAVMVVYSAWLGEDITREEIYDLGWQTLEDEWEFNRRAGWTPDADVMPACMQEDAIGPQRAVFDVPAEIVSKTYERLGPNEDFWSKGGSG